MHSRRNKILVNTASNFSLQILQVGTNFILMPLVLTYFGQEVFGINAYLGSVVIFFNFFSYSFSMTLIRYIPELIVKNKFYEMNKLIMSYLPSALLLYSILGSIIFFFPHYGLDWFNVPEHHKELTTQVMRIIGIFTFLQFMNPIVNGIINGYEKFHLNNKINLILILTSILAFIVVKQNSLTLLHYILILQIGDFICTIIKIFFALRLLGKKFRLLRPEYGAIKNVLSFNVYLLSNQVADHLMYTSDKLILQKALGPLAVTSYHISERAQQISQQFLSLPLGAILPSLTKAFNSNDNNFIRKMNLKGSILYMLFVLPPIMTLFILFDDFIILWVGNIFKDSIIGGRLFLIAIITSIPFKIYSHSLVAKGRIKEIGWAKFIYSIVNIIASFILVRFYGIIGVILPTVFFWVIIYPGVLIFTMSKEKFFDFSDLLKISLPFLVPFVIMYVLTKNIISLTCSANWFIFLEAALVIYFILLVTSLIIIFLTQNTLKVTDLYEKIYNIYNNN